MAVCLCVYVCLCMCVYVCMLACVRVNTYINVLNIFIYIRVCCVRVVFVRACLCVCVCVRTRARARDNLRDIKYMLQSIIQHIILLKTETYMYPHTFKVKMKKTIVKCSHSERIIINMNYVLKLRKSTATCY